MRFRYGHILITPASQVSRPPSSPRDIGRGGRLVVILLVGVATKACRCYAKRVSVCRVEAAAAGA